MKPIGLDAALNVKMPSRAEDAIWEAVREAINANWTPEQFRIEIASAWEDALRDDAKHAQQVFSK